MRITGVILAGGYGTRLRPLTYQIPKPLLPLFSLTLITDQLQAIASFVDQVFVLTHYKAASLRRYLKAIRLPVKIVVLREKEPMGTGGAIGFCKERFEAEAALVLNGDVIHRVDFGAYLRFFEEKECGGALLAKRVSDARRYGLLEIGRKGELKAFLEKPQEKRPGWINAGAYLLKRELLQEIPQRSCSIEHDLFPGWASRGELCAFRYEGYWLDIGTLQSYLKAHFDFLDRKWKTWRRGDLNGFRCDWQRKTIIHKSCSISRSAQVGPYAVLYPDVKIEDGASVSQSVLLQKSTVGRGSAVCRCVLGPRVRLKADQSVSDAVLGREPRR